MMGGTLLWIALGYVSCVWDCSSHTPDSRGPSATGVYILLLAMRAPRYGVLGAALCGLLLDAAQGGPLGGRVVTGVIGVALASHWRIQLPQTHWSRVVLIAVFTTAGWVATPHISNWVTGLSSTPGWPLAQSVTLTTLLTTLVVLGIRSATRPAEWSN